METFIYDKWNEELVTKFSEYLHSIKNEDKIDFEKRVVNTKKECLAIPAPVQKNIVREIYKGNYISFLDIMPHDNHTVLLICAYLISKIKDFNTQTKYISKLSKYIDNWSVVDTIKFSIKNNEDKYFNYAIKMLKSKRCFDRRIGVRILFNYKKNNDYINKVFDLIDGLANEKEYYVNMAAAWLLCDIFIFNKDAALKYYKSNKTNSFIINKSISKCRDSFRVSKEDKELLLKYRKKEA